MGALAIAIWMLAVMPVAIVVTGLAGSIALDYTFERLNRPASDGEDENGSDEA